MGEMNANLAALIGSRICHDLISPIGAINNGLELLNISGESTGPEIGLIGQSVDHASARIRFFRIAFGAAGEQMVGEAEVSSILGGLYDSSNRTAVQWQVKDAVMRSEVRLAFLAILCADAAMPYGGTITVTKKGRKWRFAGVADRISVDSALWDLISGAGSAKDLQPANVQFALLPLIARENGLKVFFQSDETSLLVEF
ncbi:MAG: histidine phosphotransferase family protein [Pseudomonadota bacterium]